MMANLRSFRRTLLFAALCLFFLVGCQEQSQSQAQPPSILPTLAPTAPVEQTRAAAPAGAGGETAVQTPSTGGGPVGPGRAPVIENHSQVTARVVETSPDPQNADWVVIRAVLLTSEPVGGQPNFTQGRVNQEVEMKAEAGGLPELKPEDTFSADVSYVGDERGGFFLARSVSKLAGRQ